MPSSAQSEMVNSVSKPAAHNPDKYEGDRIEQYLENKKLVVYIHRHQKRFLNHTPTPKIARLGQQASKLPSYAESWAWKHELENLEK